MRRMIIAAVLTALILLWGCLYTPMDRPTEVRGYV